MGIIGRALTLGALLAVAPPKAAPLPAQALSFATVLFEASRDEYQQALETQHRAEQRAIKEFRPGFTRALRHSFESVPRGVTVFYDATTGDSLDAVLRFSSEPLYDLSQPNPSRACAQIGRSITPLVTQRIRAREAAFDKAGKPILKLNGRASDKDCLATRSKALLGPIEELYWLRDVPSHLGHLVQESMLDNGIQSRDRRGRALAGGMFQILHTHNTRFARVLAAKEGLTYDWRDPVMQAWLGTAMLAVEAKRKSSVLLAKSAYHNGYYTRFALFDGADAFKQAGLVPPSLLHQFLVGREIAFEVYENNRPAGTQFGKASYQYVLEDALYNELTDALGAAQGIRSLVSHKVTRSMSLDALAKSLATSVEDLLVWNPALMQNGRAIRLTPGRVVYAPIALSSEGLRVIDYVRSTSPEREACQSEWRRLPSGQWSKDVGEALATCFENASDYAMAFALRTSTGTVSDKEEAHIARYVANVVRQRVVASMADDLVARSNELRAR